LQTNNLKSNFTTIQQGLAQQQQEITSTQAAMTALKNAIPIRALDDMNKALNNSLANNGTMTQQDMQDLQKALNLIKAGLQNLSTPNSG